MNVVIAAATGADLPIVLNLLQRCKLPQAGLEQHLATTLVAREGVRIVGSAALELYGRAAPLRSVALLPSPRGLGRRGPLTNAAPGPARSRGGKAILPPPDHARL